MVKADPKQDYYGDLGLPVTADHEDVKKQFRLLAKQYHPDRNSGHEVEVVAKFQAIQAAYEILSDPLEKRKYDIARAKQVRPVAPPPPKPSDDPYNFRKPTRASTGPFPPPPPPPPPPPQAKPKHRQYPQPQETPASAGAAKFNAFTRAANNQSWDRQRYEDAARAEAARGFAGLRTGQQTPEMPPRPPRPHPTAPRPQSSEMPNGPNPGFPGMSRASSTRRNAYPDEMPHVPRSAYAHVRASRPPQAQQPADHWSGQSPPKTRPSGSPLRHTKSSEPADRPQRPGLFERQQSRYASTAGERTDINPGLSRSSSVRNSPIDPKWEEPDFGPFGTRPRSHPPPPRRRSASPSFRTASGSTADFSDSASSEDDGIHLAPRKKAQPRQPRPRVRTQDGMDTQASFKNYTRVVRDESDGYVYPPPEPKQPTRAPFPNVTSPDDVPADRSPFSTSNHRPDPVFREANFKHEDWAERLRSTGGSTSPSKKNTTRPRGKTHPSSANPADYDVEMGEATPPDPQGHTNGVGVDNLSDLKNSGPFGSNGLDGVDDLKTNLPFESKASNDVNIDHPLDHVRLGLPKPPKTVQAPALEELTSEKFDGYCKKMNAYMHDWKAFNHKMVDHFHAREDMLEECMNPNWLTARGDGAKRDTRAGHGGYNTYMQMLDDDRKCREWWETAISNHTACMMDLGRLRSYVRDSDVALSA